MKSDNGMEVNRPESPSICKYGSVEISLLYDAPMRKMTVHVIQARGIPSRDGGQQTHTQVSNSLWLNCILNYNIYFVLGSSSNVT